MKNIYKGPLRTIRISHLEVSDGAIKTLKYNTPVLKDILFYHGLFNSFISFDYETIMPDKNEALDFVKRIITEGNITHEPYPTCSFVNPTEIQLSHTVSKKDFKELKKEYKKQRRIK